MSDYDAVLWTMEDDPRFRSTVVSVMLLDRAPDRERLLETADRLARVVPRFRQRVVPDPLSLAAPRWELDPHFDPAYHLRWTRTPEGGTVEDVLALAEPIAMQAFDKVRPLWEWTVVEGLADGRAAFITKTHHSITDGVGGVEMALQLFDLEREAGVREVPDATDTPPARWFEGAEHELKRAAGLPAIALRAGTSAVGAFARSPEGSLRKVAETVASIRSMAGGGQPLSDLMTERSLSVRYGHLEYSLQEFKDAAKASNGKVNDIYVAGIASAMKAYHAKLGGSATHARVTVMVSTRTAETAPGGNAFMPARIEVPLADASEEQVQTIRGLVQAQIDAPAMGLTSSLTGVVRRLPRSLLPTLLGPVQTSVDVLSSNIPGWPMPIYLSGAHVDRVIPFAAPGGSAFNITVMSHLGSMSVGVTADPAAVDVEVLMDCLRLGFDQAFSLGRPPTPKPAPVAAKAAPAKAKAKRAPVSR